MSDEHHLVGPDSRGRAVVSGRPPSMAVAFGMMSSLVAAVALALAFVVGARPAVWLAGLWTVLVLFCSYRAIWLRVRHPQPFLALRKARRELRARGAHELTSIVAESASAAESLVGELCVAADSKGIPLFIEVEDGDLMMSDWLAMGFRASATVEMPWGVVIVLERPSGQGLRHGKDAL